MLPVFRRIRNNIVHSHVLTCIYRSQPLEFKHDVDENFLKEVVQARISTYNADGLKLSMVICFEDYCSILNDSGQTGGSRLDGNQRPRAPTVQI